MSGNPRWIRSSPDSTAHGQMDVKKLHSSLLADAPSTNGGTTAGEEAKVIPRRNNRPSDSRGRSAVVGVR